MTKLALQPRFFWNFRFLYLVLVVGLGLTFVFQSSASVHASSSVSNHTVIIDAGHGGTDLGSTACTGLPEKDANLQIANNLKSLLEADAANVFMTRINDTTLSNNDRYTFANLSGGEVLVSVHLNGLENPAADGTQGLYGKLNKDFSFTKVMHNALLNGLKNTTSSFTDFGVTNFASGLLLKTTMPATIQETVFISNTNECNLLKTAGGARQQEIAQNLFNGLVNWFSEPTPTAKHGKNK